MRMARKRTTLCPWCEQEPPKGTRLCKCGMSLAPLAELPERTLTQLRVFRPMQFAAALRQEGRR